ncbi:MAG: ABC transporter substrate-binding protein, partial [Spirochaetia bacterium]|nr:ABC transporter substrate-binding protein [Spirochaetia bacterium]
VALNPTHKDPVLRELFNNVKFKQALSLALNRKEINEIVYLGIAEPSQYLTGNPSTCGFITDKMKNYMADYNPDKAKALLDEIGLKKDKDGFRLRPDGKPLVIYFNFCTRIASEFVELVKEYWDAIGVKVELKEVNTDLYIKTMADNDNDISVWGINGGEPPSFYNAEIAPFKPLFSGGRLEFSCGVEWEKWYKSDGKEGMEPPKDVKDLYKMYEQFQKTEFNSKDYNKLAGQMSEIISKNLYLIGTAYNLKGPVVFGERLKNAVDPTIKGYTYYYEYSTKPFQWFVE